MVYIHFFNSTAADSMFALVLSHYQNVRLSIVFWILFTRTAQVFWLFLTHNPIGQQCPQYSMSPMIHKNSEFNHYIISFSQGRNSEAIRFLHILFNYSVIYKYFRIRPLISLFQVLGWPCSVLSIVTVVWADECNRQESAWTLDRLGSVDSSLCLSGLGHDL